MGYISKPGSMAVGVNFASVYALLRAIFWGVTTAEACYLVAALASKFPHPQAAVLTVSTVLALTAYSLGRNCWFGWCKVLESRRFDIFVAFLLGVFVSTSFKGVFSAKYAALATNLSSMQVTALLLCPIIFIFLLGARGYQLGRQRKQLDEQQSFFLSDAEISSSEDDLLGVAGRAQIFAEQVLNRGSAESLVFGIDAPWGIGKSTFINFCNEYWTGKCSDRVIVYKFEPLRHDLNDNFLPKFIDGIVQAIQNEEFVPEIKPLFSRYSQLIGSGKSLLEKWLGISIPFSSNSVDEVFADIEFTLCHLNKKLVVIVDDLDRLDLESVQKILFAIKKSFTLPNVSFILCYDTENIGALDSKNPDTEKLVEFLEKFINVKISLFLDSTKLSEYVSKSLEKALAGNTQSDPHLISVVLEPLKDIYSKQFDRYLPFIGDVRKIKRLINLLVSLEVEKTDFDNTDFNKSDVLYLLLIYINYPSIFRKIYNTETNGKRGFFSALYPHDDGYPKENTHASALHSPYKNSESYEKFILELEDNPKFLIEKVFSIKQKYGGRGIDSIEEAEKRSRACFNGGWTSGKNLEEYLNLIIKTIKPERGRQYKFYLNCLARIAAGEPMEKIFGEDEYRLELMEEPHKQFWRAVVNDINSFDENSMNSIIRYLMHIMPRHSLFTDEENGLGFRDDLAYFLVKILDKGGWRDSKGRHYHNIGESLNEITEWIFGEGRHTGEGVIDMLAHRDRGILGLYDLLIFRLTSSADRDGSVFNIRNALVYHIDPNAKTEGSVRDLAKFEMREISQKIFALFKEQYIDAGKNIFALIEALTQKDVTGDYYSVIEARIAAGKMEDICNRVASLKHRVASFIVYQLSNDLIEHGVGCGLYDQSGDINGGGIKTAMNDYLFSVCFNPSDDRCILYFVDYMLINMVRGHATVPDEREYTPSIKEIAKVLDSERLINYWKDNSAKIRETFRGESARVLELENYTATYERDVPKLFTLFDEEFEKTKNKLN